MVLGGLFSVTLSVTRDLHPGRPRFHKACRPLVFGLSSGKIHFQPAIAFHIGKIPWIDDEIQPCADRESSISDETGKICASLSVQFLRVFGEGR
jgi:hypothetical protein